MHTEFEINRTKIKGGCQSGSKVVTHNSKSDFPLIMSVFNCTSLTNSFFFQFVENERSSIKNGFQVCILRIYHPK